MAMSDKPTGSDGSQAGKGLFKLLRAGLALSVQSVPSCPYSQYVRRSDPIALFLTHPAKKTVTKNMRKRPMFYFTSFVSHHYTINLHGATLDVAFQNGLRLTVDFSGKS
jgi:hypothetical protein